MLDWIIDSQLAACGYPRLDDDWAAVRAAGVTVLINLHERAHPPAVLAQHGVAEVHLPVADFTPPTQEQLRRGVEAIAEAVANGNKVLVHCGAGLGRTGTLVACYLLSQGVAPEEAIARVRRARPGSIETTAQEQAVRAFVGHAS
jgi:atypical dual specificity phosphatase